MMKSYGPLPRLFGKIPFLSGRNLGLMLSALFLTLTCFSQIASAETILDRVKDGQPIRVGYANAAPWCYTKSPGTAGGFATTITVETLKKMGYKVELVPMPEWGGLIPGLMARRFDVVACGLYIIADRCKNIEFADPLAVIGDVFLLPTGNPKHIETWEDVKHSKLRLGFIAGTNSLNTAKQQGVDLSQMISFPSRTELVAAMKAQRIDAAAENLPEAQEIIHLNPGLFAISDVKKQPKSSLNWAASGFRREDAAFAKQYNQAQKRYLGSPEMMATARPDSYDEQYLPAPDVTSDWVCKNR